MNWWILGVAACWFYEQNTYFGWNPMPKSDAELIADGLFFLLVALALVAPKIERIDVTIETHHHHDGDGE